MSGNDVGNIVLGLMLGFLLGYMITASSMFPSDDELCITLGDNRG